MKLSFAIVKGSLCCCPACRPGRAELHAVTTHSSAYTTYDNLYTPSAVFRSGSSWRFFFLFVAAKTKRLSRDIYTEEERRPKKDTGVPKRRSGTTLSARNQLSVLLVRLSEEPWSWRRLSLQRLCLYIGGSCSRDHLDPSPSLRFFLGHGGHVGDVRG